MKNSTAETAGAVLGMLLVATLTGGLFALFTNWIVSMIIEFPVTWGNWAITWCAIVILKVIFNKTNG